MISNWKIEVLKSQLVKLQQEFKDSNHTYTLYIEANLQPERHKAEIETIVSQTQQKIHHSQTEQGGRSKLDPIT